jgi:hypothetical protein
VDILDAMSFQADEWIRSARQNSPHQQEWNAEGHTTTIQADLARIRGGTGRAGGY